ARCPVVGRQAAGGPGGFRGGRVRAAHGDWVGAPAAGAWFRLRDDGLAAAAGVAAGGGVGAVARVVAGRAARRRAARVGAGGRRRQPSAGEKGGAKVGPSPVDRGRAGSKHHLLVDGGG